MCVRCDVCGDESDGEESVQLMDGFVLPGVGRIQTVISHSRSLSLIGSEPRSAVAGVLHNSMSFCLYASRSRSNKKSPVSVDWTM
ncbi:hypothetical protein EYF80_025828 [Liparis tanakae]|uniref:Uncharacterized protein n=1 Tax=Liparis tanakae TaxID=230148 RepID=A0A4Z2HE38_9TELE|nr:hypothetical protein EYF80_025828 [Liparis tanakae]